MLISNHHSLSFQFTDAYGILCARLPTLGDRDGQYATFCRIPRGKSTVFNDHFEPEMFYIIYGTGTMRINEEIRTVSAGDLIQIPSFAKHSLKNSGDDDLVFLSVYSEDFSTPHLPSSAIITAAPPTPNGALHLGHISGPYLAADVLARYLRLRASQVVMHSGTDDHQNYVYEKAQRLKVIRETIQHDFSAMHITFDEFVSPATDHQYQNKILDFANRAIALKIIAQECIELPYCSKCDDTLIDAKIKGYCPYCEEKSQGVCENCGMVVLPCDLKNSTCARCNTPSDKKHANVYTFSLSTYLPLIQADLAKQTFPYKLQLLIEKLYSMKNVKILLSYPDKSGHGLKMPNTDQTLHVWFEMAAHYEQFSLSQQYWAHFFGFDNGFYYLLFIPTLLRSMHAKAKLPDAIISNDFLHWNGLKFSTSRQHAFFVDQFTGNRDHLRLYLSFCRPEKHAENFSISAFQDFSETLEKQIVSLKSNANRVSKYPKKFVSPQKIIEANRATREMEFLLSPCNIDLRRASRQLLSFIDLTLQSKNTGNSEKMMLHALAIMMSPLMPQTSEAIFDLLQEKSSQWIRDWSSLYVTA